MSGELEKFLKNYSRFSIRISPADFLVGDIDKREGEVMLEGTRADDLNGAVRRRLVAELNRHYWMHPKDVDDTRLIFEASEIPEGTAYEEKKDGGAKLILRLKIELAMNKPEGCGCC